MTDLSLRWHLTVVNNEKTEEKNALFLRQSNTLRKEFKIWLQIKLYSWIPPLFLFSHECGDRSTQISCLHSNFVAWHCLWSLPLPDVSEVSLYLFLTLLIGAICFPISQMKNSCNVYLIINWQWAEMSLLYNWVSIYKSILFICVPNWGF